MSERTEGSRSTSHISLYASRIEPSEPPALCGVCSSRRTVCTQTVESRKTQPQKTMKPPIETSP